MSGEASMMYSKTSEQRFEISERNSYENVLEKRILWREKNVFKGFEAGAYSVQEIENKSHWGRLGPKSEWKRMRLEWCEWSRLVSGFVNSSCSLHDIEDIGRL